MPIYEYRCESCGHKHDAIQRFSDPPLLTCPACSADALKKLVSLSSFHLKGSGWYVTDYKNGGGKEGDASKADAGGSKPAEASGAEAAKPAKTETTASAPAADT